MYYPYLRGKQFELKALKEFSENNRNEDKIIPILEPVNKSINALSIAIDSFFDNGLKFSVILNPYEGDFKHHTVNLNLLEEIPILLEKKKAWIPAYLYRDNPEDLNRQITDSQFEDVLLVFKTCVDVDNTAIMNLISNEKVSIIVNNFGNTFSKRVRSRLKTLKKQIVCLEDCFTERKKNADYLMVEDEPFSDMFYYYRDENFSGFSDFTVLPSNYSEGGMLPYAIAIHLTYKKAEDEIYIHHFVSDNNSDQSNIRRKFQEAASKIEPFFQHKEHTYPIDELIERAKSLNGYPGLGYLKKLSVLNHLDLIKRLQK